MAQGSASGVHVIVVGVDGSPDALPEAGVRHRSVLHDGNPIDVVLHVIDEVGADLLVLQRAPCPVTIVPPVEGHPT